MLGVEFFQLQFKGNGLVFLRWKYQSGYGVEDLFRGLSKHRGRKTAFLLPSFLQPLLWKESRFSYCFPSTFIYLVLFYEVFSCKRARLHQAWAASLHPCYPRAAPAEVCHYFKAP